MIDARNLLMDMGIFREFDGEFPDFHSLAPATIFDLLAEATVQKYRQPKNANGSRARYFYARLVRAANRELRGY